MSIKYRVRFVYDEDASFKECNGESRPLTEEEYAANYYNRSARPGETPTVTTSGPGLVRVSYAEYLAYYGNPDRHVYIGALLDSLCPHCGVWKLGVESLWNIDCMDDNPEVQCIGQTYEQDRWDAIPGYLREVANELLQEATAL